MTEHLLVAKGAARGLAVAQAVRRQVAHLRLEASRPHAVDAGLDAAVKFRAVHLDTQLDRGAASVVAGHRGAEGAAGQFDDLKGADDAAAVAWQDVFCRHRVPGPQELMERAGALLGEFGLQTLADHLVRAGEVEFAERRPDVEAGAADKDRNLAAVFYVTDHDGGEVLVLRDARGLGNVPDVKQMVRDTPPLRLRELGGADVHAFVKLHGIGVDDLAAEFQCQVNRQVGLARGGRANDGDQHGRRWSAAQDRHAEQDRRRRVGRAAGCRGGGRALAGFPGVARAGAAHL